MKDAEKRLNAFSLFSSKSAKYEDAIELYTKAAASYKMNKNWQEAGDAYVAAAECSEKLKEEHDVCTHYVNAAKAYKNCNVKGKQGKFLCFS